MQEIWNLIRSAHIFVSLGRKDLAKEKLFKALDLQRKLATKEEKNEANEHICQAFDALGRYL